MAYRTWFLSAALFVLTSSPVLAQQNCCITLAKAEAYLQNKDWLVLVSVRLQECLMAKAQDTQNKPHSLNVPAKGTVGEIVVFAAKPDTPRVYLNVKAAQAASANIRITLDGTEVKLQDIPEGSVVLLIGKATDKGCRIEAIEAYSVSAVEKSLGLRPVK